MLFTYPKHTERDQFCSALCEVNAVACVVGIGFTVPWVLSILQEIPGKTCVPCNLHLSELHVLLPRSHQKGTELNKIALLTGVTSEIKNLSGPTLLS